MGRDDRIAAILGAWQERCEAGDRQEPEHVVAEHPDLADDLRAHFLALQAVEHAFAERRVLSGAAPRRIGDFEIVRVIGRGGMGVVYEAIQTSMARRVALKVLYPSVVGSPRAVKRFRREARVTGRLQHTNVVPVYALGHEGDLWWYAMELVEGASLGQVLKSLRSLGAEPGPGHLTLLSGMGPESVDPTAAAQAFDVEARDRAAALGAAEGMPYWRRVAAMFAEVADALETAHREGLVHRDVKPANLMLDRKGRLKLLDFGLARLADGQDAMTVTGEVLGTPAYMSPEQARARRQDVDHRTDVYSLGATLYEVLTLEAPFRGEDLADLYRQVLTQDPDHPRARNRLIPKDLETVVLKAMEKEPERRYAAAGAMARDLRAFADGYAVQARRVGPLGRLWRHVKRHKTRSALVAATVVLAVAAGALAVGQAREGEARRSREYERLLETAERTLPSLPPGGSSEAGADRESRRRTWLESPEVQEATRLLDRAITLRPERPDAWFQRALLPTRTFDEAWGDLAEAEHRGFPARSISWERARRLWSHGRIAEARGEMDRARRLLDRGVQDDWLEAEMLAQQGSWNAALACLDRAVAEAPPGSGRQRRVLRVRGYVRVRLGYRVGAIEDFAALRRAGDDGLDVPLRIAALWNDLGRHPEADQAFDEVRAEVRRRGDRDAWRTFVEGTDPRWRLAATTEAVAVHPGDAWLWARHARALGEAGRGADSLAAADRALKLAPGDARALGVRVQHLERQGRTWAAYREVRDAMASRPDDGMLRLQWVFVLQAMGRSRRALEVCDEEIAHDTGAETAWLLARTSPLLSLRRFEEALSTVDRAIARAPADANARVRKAEVLSVLGRKEEWAAVVDDLRSWEGLTAPDQLNVAVHLNNLGRFDDAEVQVDRVLASHPPTSTAHYVRAFAHARRGRWDEAVADLRAALSLSPRDLLTRRLFLDVHRERGGRVAVLALLEEWIQADPTDVWLRQEKGDFLTQRLETYPEALPAYDEALALEPRNLVLLRKRANLLAALSRFTEAMDALRAATKVDPEAADVWKDLGGMANNLGKPEEGLRHLDRALALDPDLATAYAFRAVSLSKMGRDDECLASVRKGLEVDPENVPCLRALAAEEGRRGRHDEEIALLDRALGVAPRDPMTLNNRAQALLWRGEFGRAAEDAARAVEILPSDIYGRRIHAIALRMLGRFDEALREHEEAIRLGRAGGWLAQPLWEYAGTLLQAGRHEEARRAAEESVRLEPTLHALHTLKDACMLLGDFAGVESALERAIELSPESYSQAHQDLLGLWVQTGRRSDALRLAREQARAFPEAPGPRVWLAMDLQAMGRSAKARRILEGVLENAPGDAMALNELRILLLQSGDDASLQSLLPRCLQALRDEVAVGLVGWAPILRLVEALLTSAPALRAGGDVPGASALVEEAIARAEAALRWAPGSFQLHRALLLGLRASGQEEQARSRAAGLLAQQATSLPMSTASAACRAWLHAVAGERESAARALGELQPLAVPALDAMVAAEAHAILGNADEALAFLQAARVGLDPFAFALLEPALVAISEAPRGPSGPRGN